MADHRGGSRYQLDKYEPTIHEDDLTPAQRQQIGLEPRPPVPRVEIPLSRVQDQKQVQCIEGHRFFKSRGGDAGRLLDPRKHFAGIWLCPAKSCAWLLVVISGPRDGDEPRAFRAGSGLFTVEGEPVGKVPAEWWFARVAAPPGGVQFTGLPPANRPRGRGHHRTGR